MRSDVQDKRHRPIIFAWAGGPGSSSAELAFGFLGPKRLTSPDSKGIRELIAYPDSLLDVADLVVIDPPGTGFSRELVPRGNKEYWSINGDAAAFNSFIRNWLATHGRLDSPIFFLGESYGGFRAGKLVAGMVDLDVDGLILISPGLNLNLQRGDLSAVSDDPEWIGGVDDDQAFIVNFPSMAVAAVAQGRIPAGGRSISEIYDQAKGFAEGPLAAALWKGAALSTADRDILAGTMSRLIGLPAAMIAQADLRVQSSAFLGRIVGWSRGQPSGHADFHPEDKREQGSKALETARRSGSRYQRRDYQAVSVGRKIPTQ